MHLEDRLGCQRLVAVGGVEHPVVEGLQMVGSETADRDPPEGGEDVPVDLPAVTVPGRLGQSELLPGKPLTGQVGAERERAHLVVTAVQLGGQTGGQLLSFRLGCRRDATSSSLCR